MHIKFVSVDLLNEITILQLSVMKNVVLYYNIIILYYTAIKKKITNLDAY